MARSPAAERVQLVSVRAVGEGYPFYGEVLTGTGQPFRSLLRDDSVLVHSALLLKMGLRVGDDLQVGQSRFRIADVLVREPDSPVQVFNLGPRVLMTEAAARAAELLEQVGLSPRAQHYPAQLSGGEQQRVAIARAFACRPPVLLADEPTGNLDSQTGAQIIGLLQRLHREEQATLVLVTHDPEIARAAQRTIQLLDGRVVGDSAPHAGGEAAPRAVAG
jgi:ABC-type dipeptide/oligopeptide/nickel transport system ATPase component